ncbi:MAG: hypothetical protein Q9216_005485 [Gyalolechia sp. 2 TL-2023]
MNLPNELLLLILGHLSNKDLKQARLACRKLALLGLEALNVETVYISPRNKDMEVFDAITQHPILRKSVKHLVYDLAQFVNLHPEHYFTALCRQIDLQSRLGSDRELQRLVEEYIQPKKNAPQEELFVRFLRDRTLMDGFSHYKTLAQEQRNFLTGTWFARAHKGLEAIGTLESVTISCAWNMHHPPGPTASRRTENESNTTNNNHGNVFAGGHNEIVDRNAVIGKGEGTEEEPVYVELGNYMSFNKQARSGVYSGRSPVARSWPPTHLLPTVTATPYISPSIAELHRRGITDGSFEAFKVVQLLRSANMQPFKVLMPDGGLAGEGVPPVVFDLGRWPDPIQLRALWRSIQVLNINIAYFSGDPPPYTKDVFPCLDGLQSLFHDAPALQTLSLRLPMETHPVTGHNMFYNYLQIFPPITEWCSPTMTTLKLHSLSASYRDLAGLLFLNLPLLQDLELANIQLTDGKWDDIVEGLRRADNLSRCRFPEPLLYPPDTYYITQPNDVEDWEDTAHYRFLNNLARYVTEGGRHPDLREDEPDSFSGKYMIKLNETLDEIRQARASVSQ